MLSYEEESSKNPTASAVTAMGAPGEFGINGLPFSLSFPPLLPPFKLNLAILMNTNRSNSFPAFFLALVMLGASGAGCKRDAIPKPAPEPALPPVVIAVPQKIPLTRLSAAYQPVAVDDIHPAAAQYPLPLDLTTLSNPEFADRLFPDPATAANCKTLLRQNGFAIFPGSNDDVSGFYSNIKSRELPIFITSDSLLHLYHIQFDETLKSIEVCVLEADLKEIAAALQAASLELAGKTRGTAHSAARLLVGYTTIPLIILGGKPEQTTKRNAKTETDEELADWDQDREWPPTPDPAPPFEKLQLNQIPVMVDQPVRDELKLIFEGQGMAASPLMSYQEDYSQYVPRGHYTCSEELANYFRAAMWCGRMTFLLREGLVTQDEADVQTLAACMLAMLMDTKLPDGRTVAQAWQRLYAVTNFYVGFSDDLTPAEFLRVIHELLGASVAVSALGDPATILQLRNRLAALRLPGIFSGTGNPVGPPVALASEADLAKVLKQTQGLRLMGQRDVPDSQVMGSLVYPKVGLPTGSGERFTLVTSPGGPGRGFPRGLDVMCVLGSDRARHWLRELGDDQYQRYDQQLTQLRQQFAALDAAAWNRNAYWAWLHALRPLLDQVPAGYPTFMRTNAWRDKQLSASLASWSQLRHDTILYAKQFHNIPTGMSRRSVAPPPKMVEGYVEPVPLFYARILALTRMTLTSLDGMKVLNKASKKRLQELEKIVARLLELSKLELENQRLTDEDYQFIRSFGSNLESVVTGLSDWDLDTTIIADVHTDPTSGQVLQEGTGRLNYLVAVYPMPDGGLVAGIGPILSHYEFKQPMSGRLQDKDWKEMLGSGKAPPLPPWIQPITAP